MNSCFIWEEDSSELLRNIDWDNIKSINATITESYKETEESIFSHNTIVDENYKYKKLSLTSRTRLKIIFKMMVENTYLKGFRSQDEMDKYFAVVEKWGKNYKIYETRRDSSYSKLNSRFTFQISLVFIESDHNNFSILMDFNGFSYNFCCKDNDQFPFNTFKGLTKYPREWVFEDSVKVEFVKLVNSLLKEVPSNNKLQFISK